MVAQKLQIKPGQQVVVLRQPDGVDLGVEETSGASGDVVVLFARTAADLEGEDGDTVVAAAARDDLAWVAYPKAGQLGTDLNRDKLAGLLTARGVQPVRQIAIDDVWSALRFRPT